MATQSQLIQEATNLRQKLGAMMNKAIYTENYKRLQRISEKARKRWLRRHGYKV